MNWDSQNFIQILENKWTKWTGSNTWSNELRFRKLHSNHQEQVNKVNKVNKLKYFAKWIEIQKASLKSLWTSEQGEQSEQTQIVSQMNWDSQSFIQILENKWTKWTNSNTLSNELRFTELHSNPWEQVNKVNRLKYLVKWIEIQKASFKSSRTSEQGEQSEQTQILC